MKYKHELLPQFCLRDSTAKGISMSTSGLVFIALRTTNTNPTAA